MYVIRLKEKIDTNLLKILKELQDKSMKTKIGDSRAFDDLSKLGEYKTNMKVVFYGLAYLLSTRGVEFELIE